MHHQNAAFSLLVATTLLSVWASGCSEQATGTAPAQGPPSVVVAKPVVMPLVEWDEYTGRLDAIDSVEVRARVSGYLKSTHFEEGQMVAAGDLLAVVDPRPFEAELNAATALLLASQSQSKEAAAQLRQAQAELADAQAQETLTERRFERTKELAARSATSQDEVDNRESDYVQAQAAVEVAKAKIDTSNAAIATAAAAIESAKANVEAAELNLEYTRVRAPISGRVSRRFVTDGNLISGGTNASTLLTTIVSLSPIHVYFDANEQEFLKYSRLAASGQRASSRVVKNPVFVALLDEDGFPHQGHMDFVDNRLDPNTATMRGRAILPNDDGVLTPGLFVDVRLPGSGRYDAVLIPDSAIASDQADKFVYVLETNEGGSDTAPTGPIKLRRQVVKLGPIAHDLRIVREGLDGSEFLVTRGLQRIRPGAEVMTETETITPGESPLPDDYQPVPKEQWLSRKPAPPPTEIKQNDQSPASPEATSADEGAAQ